jgi:hypothetical protein
VVAWPQLKVVRRRKDAGYLGPLWALGPKYLYEYSNETGFLSSIDLNRKNLCLGKVRIVAPIDEEDWVASIKISPNARFALFIPSITYGSDAMFSPAVYCIEELEEESFKVAEYYFWKSYPDDPANFCEFLGANDDILAIAHGGGHYGGSPKIVFFDLDDDEPYRMGGAYRDVLLGYDEDEDEYSEEEEKTLRLWYADDGVLYRPISSTSGDTNKVQYRIYDTTIDEVAETAWFEIGADEMILFASYVGEDDTFIVATPKQVFILETPSVLSDRIVTFILCCNQLELFPYEIIEIIVKHMRNSDEVGLELKDELKRDQLQKFVKEKKKPFSGEPSCLCKKCNIRRKESEFSKSQWKRKANSRTCKDCQEKAKK